MRKFNTYNNMRFARDECYTTAAESNKLVDYLTQNNLIDKKSIIWLPFDNELSNIYKALKTSGYTTILSNLELGLDFYNYEPKQWDIIISNPPFSNRTQLMNRLLSFGKPFIILQGTQFFNNQYAVNHLCQYSDDFQFLLPRSRMNFLTYNETENVVKTSKNAASFYSFWLCYKMNLDKTFNSLKDNGKEKHVEMYDSVGNVIKDNHYSLFTYLDKKGE